jgi:hypothetical protein
MITLKGGLETLYSQTNTNMAGAAAAVSGS